MCLQKPGQYWSGCWRGVRRQMQAKELQVGVAQNTGGLEDGSCLKPEDCKHPFKLLVALNAAFMLTGIACCNTSTNCTIS